MLCWAYLGVYLLYGCVFQGHAVQQHTQLLLIILAVSPGGE